MANYSHAALRGDQIHEAKIKILPAGSALPVPEWEGQFLAVGRTLYYSVLQNNTLVWIAPTASNPPVLPANVLVFETGSQNPPSPRSGSGRIYSNLETRDNWYLSGGQWIKLGATASSSNFELVSGRAAENWEGNYFGLINPSDVNQDNCLLIKKYLTNTQYYLAIRAPSMQFLGSASDDNLFYSDDNLFYFELWRDYTKIILSTHSDSRESLGVINTSTSLFANSTAAYRLGIYLKRNSTKIYLNFNWRPDERLLEIKGIANIYYNF